MAPQLPSGMPRRRNFEPYTLIWITFGCFATIYVALLLTRPELLATVSPATADLERQVSELKRDVTRGFADIEPVRQTVGEVRMEVDNLKAVVEESADRDRILMEKVSALEMSVKQREQAPAPAEAPTTAAVPPKPQPKAAAKAAGGAPAAPAKAPAAAAKSIETGSIDHAKAPAPKPAKSPVGVLLATGTSVDALRLNWSILTDRHADAVKNLNPRYVVSGNGDERSYGLVAGPVASTTEAASVCKVMEQRGVPCEISLYRGNAL